jgi:hypothetical protein
MVYIGQTIRDIQFRWKQHIASAERGGSTSFCEAIRRYGKEAFEISIIANTIDQMSLNLKERRLIQAFNSSDPSIGYNTYGVIEIEEPVDTKETFEKTVLSAIIPDYNITVSVYTRHSVKCPKRAEGSKCTNCNCRKTIYIREKNHTKYISAKTRVWSRANEIAQEILFGMTQLSLRNKTSYLKDLS